MPLWQSNGEQNPYSGGMRTIQGGTGRARGEMRDMNEDGMKSFEALDSREKMIAILGDRWWPPTAKQEGDTICKRFLCNVWKKRNEHRTVGGVSIRSRNGAPSRKGCVVNGQTAKASNKCVRPVTSWSGTRGGLLDAYESACLLGCR